MGDSGADIFPFWDVCRAESGAFVIRVGQDRLMALPAEQHAGKRISSAAVCHPKMLRCGICERNASVRLVMRLCR